MADFKVDEIRTYRNNNDYPKRLHFIWNHFNNSKANINCTSNTEKKLNEMFGTSIFGTYQRLQLCLLLKNILTVGIRFE